MTRADRIAGSMYGAAIGDALGSAFEFVDAATIHRTLGTPFVFEYRAALPGSLLHPRKPGRPTDDTAMALCVAAAMSGGEPLTPDVFARQFLEDLERSKGRFADMFWGGGPGGATTRALSRLSHGADPAACGHSEDGGNGAAMRVHPLGFLEDRDEVLRLAAIQARVTHGHPAAVAAAQAVAVLVYDALAGVEPSADPPAGVSDKTFVAAWHALHRDVLKFQPLPTHLRNIAMSGWATVAGAHAIALAFAADPARAIAAAAASGGDTDTVGSIAGAIVGARCGLGALPPRWVEGLHGRAMVDAAIDGFRIAEGRSSTNVLLAGNVQTEKGAAPRLHTADP